MIRALAAGVLAIASFATQAQCVTPLPIGTTATAPQPLPGNAFTASVCIDVPAGTERLTVRLLASPSTRDLDLFVRVDSPFFDPATESLEALTIDDLFERAHYYSASAAGDEFVILNRASKQPLRPGRLHLVLLNFESTPVGFSIGSEVSSGSTFSPIEVVFNDPGTSGGSTACNLTGWNDTSPRTPVRGNNGTTLGQQRRNAMLEAARLMGEQLRPSAPIRIQACWDTYPFDSSGGGLAQAGPRFVVVDNPGLGLVAPYLDKRHTVHFSPSAGHQAGTSFCRFLGGSCTTADVRATFNLAVDQASNANQRFDYGIDPAPLNSPMSSFVAVALHELAHGMGFVGLVGLGGEGDDPLGVRPTLFGSTYDDAFGRFARILIAGTQPNTVKEFLRATDSERATALTSVNKLRFDSPRSVASLSNNLRDMSPPNNLVQLHAPASVATGGSYSHLGAFHDSQLMLATTSSPAIRSLGLAGDMLQDIGFDSAPKTVPVFPAPPDVQYFDVARNGHGIDFRRVAGTTDLYFLGFYSYDANGNPEWYTALGRIIDGVFMPLQNASGDSLQRFNYQPGPPPTSTPDPSPTFNGQMRVDFVDARRSPVCLDGAPGRILDGPLALMTWTLGSETRQWCMQPLVDAAAPVNLDVSSVWFNPDDAGWGITVQSFPGSGGDGIAIGVYYPDAAGNGRWGVVQSPTYDPNQTYTVRQVQGYCRGPQCPTPANLSFVDIGTLKINLRPPSEGPSTLTLDVTYPGMEGGRFQRTDSPLLPANSPRFRGN